MNREILFRGKETESGEWIYGHYAALNWWLDGSRVHIIIPLYATGYPHCDLDYCKVDPDTVGQYTGLDDKDGNKIFDGDILQSDLSTGDIKWNETHASFLMLTRSATGSMCYVSIDEANTKHMKIVGNIWDSPELLEE